MKLKYFLIFFIIFTFSPMLLLSQEQPQQKVITEEELKKIDPKEIEKQKIERKTGGEIPKEEKLEIIEQPKVQQQKESVIKRYRPNILFLESNGFKFGSPLTPKEKEPSKESKEQQIKKDETVLNKFEGHCEPKETYKISLYPVPAFLHCFISKDNQKRQFYEIKGRWKPTVGEKLFLTFEVTEQKICQNLKEISIVKQSDYSPDLHTSVDRKIWENALLKALTKTGSQVSSSAVEKMRTPNKKTILLNEGGLTIVEEQQQQTWKDFRDQIPVILASNITEAVTQEILSAYGGRIPPIFTVEKGEIYFVEGLCNGQEKK